MQRLRPHLPWLLLLLFPLAHVLLVGAFLPEDQKTGYWQIGAIVFFLMDGLLALLLILLLYARMAWSGRANALTVLGILTIAMGIFTILFDQQHAVVVPLVVHGGAALVIALCRLWLERHKEQK